MRAFRYSLVLLIAVASLAVPPPASGQAVKTMDLLPKIAGWVFSEDPVLYGPESLFEYIDGAAEAFIGYDLVDAAVGQYKQEGAPGTLSVDIYDMGKPLNAFGIYAAERYSESRFLPIGVQGYLEEGTLNFLAGKYYVKMMAYDAGDKTEAALRACAAAILAKIGDPGGFPAVLSAFPSEGRAANSERFILRSFLGLEFLKNGLTASYKTAGGGYEAFVMELSGESEAADLLRRYLDKAASGTAAPEAGNTVRFKDPYLDNVTIGRSGRFLFGTTKVKDADRAAGDLTAAGLAAALAGGTAGK
jgi:hypothetical protein